MIKGESPTSNERGETTVSIIANSAIVRAGLETLVASDGRFVVIESAAQFSPPDSSFDLSPDIILYDVPNSNDLTQIVESQNQSPERLTNNDSSSIVVLISTNSVRQSDLQNIFRVPTIRGILSRDASADEILSAIESAANDLFVIAPEIFGIFLSESNDESNLSFEINDDLKISLTQSEFVEKLTRRELETLELLAEGVGNKAIAARLNISEHTVKFHIASIFGKLSVTTRTEAVTEGLRRGLILL